MLFERAAGVKQQMPRFSEHFVGLPFALAFCGVAFELEIQSFSRGFNLLERSSTMAVVIVIRVFQQDIGVRDFLARRLGVNASTKRQGDPDGENL